MVGNRAAYRKEIKSAESKAALERFAEIVRKGRPVTLLCASSCTDRERCHRSLARAAFLSEI